MEERQCSGILASLLLPKDSDMITPNKKLFTSVTYKYWELMKSHVQCSGGGNEIIGAV